MAGGEPPALPQEKIEELQARLNAEQSENAGVIGRLESLVAAVEVSRLRCRKKRLVCKHLQRRARPHQAKGHQWATCGHCFGGAQLRKEELRQLRTRQAVDAGLEEEAMLRKFTGDVTLTFRADRTVMLTPQQARRARASLERRSHPDSGAVQKQSSYHVTLV